MRDLSTNELGNVYGAGGRSCSPRPPSHGGGGSKSKKSKKSKSKKSKSKKSRRRC